MIFGLFSKSKPLDASLADAALRSFGLSGQRAFEKVTKDRFLGACATSGSAYVPRTETVDRVAMAVGHPTGSGHLTADLVGPGAIQAPPADVHGSFAFARYDGTTGELVLGNDAFGFQALFIVETAEMVAFCSEYEPLLELPGVSNELDHDAVAQYYVFGLTLQNRTFARSITMLPAGTIRTFDAEGSRELLYDDLDIKIDAGKSIDAYAKIVGQSFKEVVQRNCDAYPENDVALTGGADTRLMLSCMTEEQRKRHRFVTHYAEKGAAETDRDVVVAKMLAARAGVEHEAIFLDHGHLPFEPSVFGDHRVKSVMEGSSHGCILGGEYLGGACVDVGLFPARQVTREAVDSRLRSIFQASFLEGLTEHPYDALQKELGAIRAENLEMTFWVNAFARPFFSQLYFGTHGVRTSTWMVPWQMHQRIITPFADPDFLRVLLTVPFEFLSSYRLYNAIYAYEFRDFVDVPTNSGLAVRSDSALTMFTQGDEPKKVRRTQMQNGRVLALKRHLDAAGQPGRDFYAKGSVATLLRDEKDRSERKSMMTRLKDRYTKSFLFKARHTLPIHGMLMKWKAKSETTAAARVTLPLMPMFSDFEDWCDYTGVGTVRTSVTDSRKAG